jgi:outer membrane receptor protein involved in Fe transport
MYGSYLFDEDTTSISPQYAINGIASFTRQTTRFGISVAAFATHVGEHSCPLFHYQEAFTTFGCSATLRFVTLTFAARLDNIFDTDYAFCDAYPLPPRSFTLNIQWQFWH